MKNVATTSGKTLHQISGFRKCYLKEPSLDPGSPVTRSCTYKENHLSFFFFKETEFLPNFTGLTVSLNCYFCNMFSGS